MRTLDPTRFLISVCVTICALLFGISTASAQKTLEITVTTMATPDDHPGAYYEPANAMVVWIEDTGGNFVATIDGAANDRRRHLVTYAAKAGGPDVDADAISSASRNNHGTPFSTTWDLLDRAGTEIPDGDYLIFVELADENTADGGGVPANNNLGQFAFTKGATTATTNPPDDGGFAAVTLFLTVPNADDCGNGVIDPGETCDSAASGSEACLSDCVDTTADACMPNQLSGGGATCDAECNIVEITACAGGDGCCPEGCSLGDDSDCEGDSGNIVGGCSASGGAAGAGTMLFLLGLAFITIRRRREDD